MGSDPNKWGIRLASEKAHARLGQPRPVKSGLRWAMRPAEIRFVRPTSSLRLSSDVRVLRSWHHSNPCFAREKQEGRSWPRGVRYCFDSRTKVLGFMGSISPSSLATQGSSHEAYLVSGILSRVKGTARARRGIGVEGDDKLARAYTSAGCIGHTQSSHCWPSP
jgi:hypothetical protein